jgi:hypothetical protein
LADYAPLVSCSFLFIFWEDSEMYLNNEKPVDILYRAGIKWDDAVALRRIAMTLHRWHELECGTGNGCIERDEKTNIPYWYNANSRFVAAHDPRAYTRIPDRETGALKRLKAIMANYPGFGFYVQGDPRGAPLYILRPGDIPPGSSVESCYNRGIAVYK